MDNIIEFPKRKEPISPYDTEGIIDTTKKGVDLEISIGLFWHNLYSGQKIKEIYANDEGIISYEMEWRDISEVHVLKSHFYMMMQFINDQKIGNEFFKAYDLYIKETGMDRLIGLKEDKPNDSRDFK